MSLSNTERQRRYKRKAKDTGLDRIEARIPVEKATKLRYLAHHWGCTKTEALTRAILETWERAGSPVSGCDPEED